MVWEENNTRSISLYMYYSLNLQFASLIEVPAFVYIRHSFALGRLHMDSLHKLDSTIIKKKG